MKKLLALVLALVMTLSLCVTSNAAYADAADVDYTEAVDVMSAVGVFQGADGKFSPKAELTREQAAKLIAYLDLGEKVAEALPAVKVFNDVEANRWSAKYVAYCADAGYINGVGDGNFDPAGKLTGYAFGKMLLCVLGYDASIEEFTGSNWQIAVAKLMQSNDIAKSVDASSSATLTREQAAQYCLNALQADMVEYATKGTNVTINGAVIATGASAAKKVANTKADDYRLVAADKDTVVQLCEKLYGTKLTKGTDNGDFGVISNTWKYKAKKVGSYADETPVLTYTASVKEKDLFTDLGADGISGTTAKYIVLDEIWVDGVQVAASKEATTAGQYTYVTPVTSGDNANTYLEAYNNSVVIAKADKTKVVGPGNGVLTMIYEIDNATNHYKMVCENQYLAEVTKVTKADSTTGKDRYVTVTGSKTFETEDFAKEDMVVYTISAGEIKSMALATTVENVAVTAYSKGDSVTAGGTTYKYSKTVGDFKDTAYSMKSGDSYTFYLDANGYVIGGEAYTTTNTDYAYVLGSKLNNNSKLDQADFSTKYEGKYQVIDMTGKVSTIKTLEADENADLEKGNYVTYEADKDNAGYMKIKKVYSASSNKYETTSKSTAGFLASKDAVTKFTKSVASVAPLNFNNSTVFVLKTGTNTYKVVTGLSAMDSWTNIDSQKINTITKDGVAVVAYLDCSKTGAGSSSDSDKLVYIIDTDYTVAFDKTADEYIYTFKTVDGKVSALSSAVDTAAADQDAHFFDSEGLWRIDTTSDGFVNKVTKLPETGTTSKYVEDTSLSGAAGEVKYEDGVLTITAANNSATSYLLDSSVSVTIIDNDDKVNAEASAKDLEGDAVKGVFTMIQNSSSNKTIKTIYFNGSID